MQNRYAGDIGDFGKIGLLKSLFNKPKYRLGIIWCLFPDESHNNDGSHVDYLKNEKYVSCDRKLAANLSQVIINNRTVSSLKNSIQISNPVVCHSDVLNFHQQYPTQRTVDKKKRKSLRREWLAEAKETFRECNAIFIDPDNGIEVKSCSHLSQLKAGKYAFYSEIEELFYGKDVCVIYHHLNRSSSHKKQIHKRCHELRECINPDGAIYALRFNPYSPRAYFILTNKASQISIKNNIKSFREGPWKPFWDSYLEN